MPNWFKGEVKVIRQELVPVRVSWVCPYCRVGAMVFNGQTWLSNPPGYHHQCDACGLMAVIRKSYPSIEYETTGRQVDPFTLCDRVFKGRDCGYMGEDSTCTRTLEDCKRKGNAAHFNGCRGKS